MTVARNPASIEASPLQEALLKIPVRSILLKCGSQESSSSCYQSALILQFDETFRKVQSSHLDLKISAYREEQKDFLSLRSYEQVSKEVNRFHQSVLSGIEFKARERAEALFHSCDQEKHSDHAIDRFDLFSGGITEMPKGVYSCLVSKWTESEDVLLEETSDRLGLTLVTEDAKKWIKSQQVRSIFEQSIAESALKKSKLERETFEKEKRNLLKDLDPKQSEELALQEWAPRLREQFFYSPVEQWILEYRQAPKK